MTGSTKLRRLQLGRESPLGTEVNATTRWRGIGTAEDARETVFPDEHVGYRSRVVRSYQPSVGGLLELDSTEATYEQLLHILEMSIDEVAPVQDGAGSNYLSDYYFATTTQEVPKSYTIEAGNNQAEDILTGCVCTAFTIEGVAKEAVKMSATIQSQQIADGSFTGSVSIPTVSEILFQQTQLYIDSVGSAIGSTEKANTLLGYTLNVNTGVVPVYTGSGNLYYSHLEYGEPEITLDLKLLHNTMADVQKEIWRVGTARQIRLANTGPAVATAGTSHANKKMRIDVVGEYEKVNKLGEEDGYDIMELTLRAGYDSTADLFARIFMVHELSAVQ